MFFIFTNILILSLGLSIIIIAMVAWSIIIAAMVAWSIIIAAMVAMVNVMVAVVDVILAKSEEMVSIKMIGPKVLGVIKVLGK